MAQTATITRLVYSDILSRSPKAARGFVVAYLPLQTYSSQYSNLQYVYEYIYTCIYICG